VAEIIDPIVINDNDPSPTESTLLHPYPGSMPAFLASRLIERYSNSGDMIFDPFCGSGVVLVESIKQGRNATGMDLLEIPLFIAKTATSMPNASDIRDCWMRVKHAALNDVSIFSSLKSPGLPGVCVQELSNWFHAETLAEILAIRNHVGLSSKSKSEVVIALVLGGALLSLSKRVSRGVLHWGWIADNVLPGKLDLYVVNVFQEMDWRINRLVSFMDATGTEDLISRNTCIIKRVDWTSERESEIEVCDLLLTSPPYPYSIDYTLALRLSHYLYGIDFNEMRASEIGARYKRKRKARRDDYLFEIRKALHGASKAVRDDGLAAFVLPHPDDYPAALNLSEGEWMNYINDSLSGSWQVEEFGVRDCLQRRVVHSTLANRRELVLVCRKSNSK